MTTITVADNAPPYWDGLTITINGEHFVVTDVTGATLTIRPRNFVDRTKSTFYYWRNKAIFLYWDIAEEFIENWEDFNEWRNS